MFATLPAMEQRFNFDEIKRLYKQYYGEAVERGIHHLPYYEIQQWDQVLNKIDGRIFEDVRAMGIPLYPIFPVTEGTYLHFANPFCRVGIEIIYKSTPQALVERKVNLLKAEGWTIYTTNSQQTYYGIEEFFKLKRKNETIDFDDLPDETKYSFAKKYNTENAACLLYYLKVTYFMESSKTGHF